MIRTTYDANDNAAQVLQCRSVLRTESAAALLSNFLAGAAQRKAGEACNAKQRRLSQATNGEISKELTKRSTHHSFRWFFWS